MIKAAQGTQPCPAGIFGRENFLMSRRLHTANISDLGSRGTSPHQHFDFATVAPLKNLFHQPRRFRCYYAGGFDWRIILQP
jgi:hypothetical protein